MGKIAKFLFGSGTLAFLIGGSGLDGPTSIPCAILTAASFAVAAVGYRLWVMSERKEAHETAREERRRKEIEAAKKTFEESKDTTFQVWLESGKLDVQV